MRSFSVVHKSAFAAALLLLVLAAAFYPSKQPPTPFENPWPEARFALLQVLSIPPQIETSQAPDDPLVELGHTLFYDTQLNPDTGIGCVSCHLPALGFSDGLKSPKDNPNSRNAPGLIGASQHRWQFWDGRKDSTWSQAFGPLYAAHEIGLTPDQLLKKVMESPKYLALYESAFEPWPEHLPQADKADSPAGLVLQARLGLAIEAYLQQLTHKQSPFDHYVQALGEKNNAEANRWLNADQQAGLQVFLRSNCLSCHRGSAFSDGRFHNIGTGESDAGRAEGLKLWQQDQFNCESDVAAAIGRPCDINAESEAEITRLLNGAFKTPSLRELSHTAPYMHDGRYPSLEDVVEHYRHPPEGEHGLAAIQPIDDKEAQQLTTFLKALSSPIDAKAWFNNPPDYRHNPQGSGPRPCESMQWPGHSTRGCGPPIKHALWIHRHSRVLT